jgi:hypothetical protein
VNYQDAKRTLLAYRPDSVDRDDPEVAEALDLAQRDPALQAWLERHEAFQNTVRSELRSLPVPADLKARILSRSPAPNKVVRLDWHRPAWLLAAACVTLALVLSALWIQRPREDETFAGFRSRMVGFSLREYRMDILTSNPGQVRDYLRQHGAPADYVLTPGLQTTPVMGGARLSWQGHPVSMVCFSLAEKQILYMFVVDETAVRGGKSPGGSPVLQSTKGLMTASWSQAGKIYLIAAATRPQVLEQKTPRGA